MSLSVDQFIKLLAESYSENEVTRYKSYKTSQADLEYIAQVGKDILKNFPFKPHCCAPMSALWAAIVRDNTNIPAYLVAGSVDLHGVRVFGDDKEMQTINAIFSESNLNWDGHCWVVFGDYIGEISLFRTAYATTSPAWLRDLVIKTFGEGRGLIIDRPDGLMQDGLIYCPKYVPIDSQLTSLVKGAHAMCMS